MKKLVSLILFLFFVISVNAEIIDWKGSELGIPSSPAWLTQFKETGKISVLRKKFDIDRTSKVIIGFGKSDELEEAKYLSEMNATKTFSKLLKDNSKAKMVFVYEYWEQDDEEIYAVYSIYQVANSK